MNVTANLQQQAQIIANKELKKPFLSATSASRTPEVKLPELTDQVVLTTVNSSSFDKYVEEMENGKQGVADNFVRTLENFVGDFVKGIVSTLETDSTTTVQTNSTETNNSSSTNNANNNGKTEADYDKEIEELNTKLEEIWKKEEDLFAKLTNASQSGDKVLAEKLQNELYVLTDESSKLQVQREKLIYAKTALKYPELSDLAQKLSDVLQEQYDLNKDYGEKSRSQHQSGNFSWEEYHQYEDKNYELASKYADLDAEFSTKLTNLEFAEDLKTLDGDKKQQAAELQEKIKELLNKRIDLVKQSHNLTYEFNSANRKDNAKEIQANLSPKMDSLDKEFMQLNQELSNLYEQYYSILNGTELAETQTQQPSQPAANSNVTTTTTTFQQTEEPKDNLFINKTAQKRDEERKANLFTRTSSSSSETTFTKANFSFLSGTSKETKVDADVAKIVNSIKTSNPDLQTILDAFKNAGQKVDVKTVLSVAEQLGVHVNVTELLKALKED